MQGNEPPTLLRTKGAGDSFGELALMYDNVRNATCQATTFTLLWAVNRATFKSIIGRHLTGSPVAQVCSLFEHHLKGVIPKRSQSVQFSTCIVAGAEGSTSPKKVIDKRNCELKHPVQHNHFPQGPDYTSCRCNYGQGSVLLQPGS